MENITNVFKSLSDKNRIRILIMLTVKKLCVCEIQEILELSVSTVSKHLSILKDAGFLIDEKDGKWVNYSLNYSNTNFLINQILLILPLNLKDDETIKSDLEKVKKSDRNVLCNSGKIKIITNL